MCWPSSVLPLLTLVVDGGRLYFVRQRLQTAVDAACEDAAWSAADKRTIPGDSGVTTFQTTSTQIAAAQNTFYQTLGERSAANYSARVGINPDYANARMICLAQASVPLLTAGGLLYSPAVITTTSISKIRFAR